MTDHSTNDDQDFEKTIQDPWLKPPPLPDISDVMDQAQALPENMQRLAVAMTTVIYKEKNIADKMPEPVARIIAERLAHSQPEPWKETYLHMLSALCTLVELKAQLTLADGLPQPLSPFSAEGQACAAEVSAWFNQRHKEKLAAQADDEASSTDKGMSFPGTEGVCG